MNSVWFASVLPLLLAASPAQTGGSKPNDTMPAPTNIRGAEYPRIHTDLRVTFRIKRRTHRRSSSGSLIASGIPRRRAKMASGPRPRNRRCRGSITTGCSSTARK